MPGRERFRAGLLRYVELPGAKLLRALGFTPNAITILGFLVSVAAAVLVAYGWLLPGGIVFLVGGGLDLVDGGKGPDHTGSGQDHNVHRRAWLEPQLVDRPQGRSLTHRVSSTPPQECPHRSILSAPSL